jgi:hypothetical protein
VAAFQPLYPTITHSRLTKNCVGRPTVEVRTAVCAKWPQFPDPTVKPSSRKPASTMSLVEVRAFCTLAVRPSPKQLRMVKPAMRHDASTCPWPRRSDKIPDPTVVVALASCRLGKKWPR